LFENGFVTFFHQNAGTINVNATFYIFKKSIVGHCLHKEGLNCLEASNRRGTLNKAKMSVMKAYAAITVNGLIEHFSKRFGIPF